jgi:serine phosphatase RsbU (regulator of sigma subunit)
MAVSLTADAVVSAVSAPPREDTRLHGAGLSLARAGWLITFGLMVVIFAVSLPFRFAHYRAVCLRYRCLVDELTPADLTILRRLGLSPDVYAAGFVALAVLLFAAFVAVALVLFWRRSDDWLVLFASITLVLFGGTFPSTINFLLPSFPEAHLLLDLFPFAGAVSPILFFCVFPDGQLVPRWAIGVGGVYVADQALHFLLVPIDPRFTRVFTSTQLPAYFLIYAGIVAAQGVRYRWHATPRQRQQTKWVVVGLATALAGYLAAVVPFALDHSIGNLPFSGLVATTVAYAAQLFLPISIAFAVLRTRLWEVDLIINRALVYGPVTLFLAGIYFVSVATFGLLWRTLTGETGDAAAVLSTLVIVALFVPIRRRVQRFVDRHFYRQQYDAAQTIAAFSESVRDVVGLADLATRLLRVVHETIQPQHVWLDVRGDLALSVAPALLPTPRAFDPRDPLVSRCLATPTALSVDRLRMSSPLLEILRPTGLELIVPVVGDRELLALLSLSPRRSGLEYSPDDRRLLTTLAAQTAPGLRVAEMIEQTRREAQQRERVEQELRLARQIQHSLLPSDVPSLPGWEIVAHYRSAREVGGDFYDFITLPENRLAIVIGDATDKGMPAALLMAATRGAIRAVGSAGVPPDGVLTRVNELLCADTAGRSFVTCLYAVLDPAAGCLRYANAGHVPLFRRGSEGVDELSSGDLPLGVLPDVSFAEHELVLEPTDEILFSSDGLVEARDETGELYGFDRLAQALDYLPRDANLIDALLADLATFTPPTSEPDDDLTLVTLRRHLTPVPRT